MLHGLDRKRIQALHPPPLSALEIDVADGVRAPTAEARSLGKLVRYVRARVGPGEPVFVANPRYDLVKVGNPLVYVLLDRPNPTRYDVMQPGVVTTAEVQREIVADLERAGPELVVRWLAPVAAEAEPNGAGRSSGVRILDRYLARSYREDRRFGDYAVLRRRSGDRAERGNDRRPSARHAAGPARYAHLVPRRGSDVSGGSRPRRFRGAARRTPCARSRLRVWAATATRSASAASSDALDVNEEYVEAARGIGVRADRYDGERLPLADGAVDTVIMVEVLEHLDAPGDLLDEAARVAGRNVLVTTPNCTQRFPAATIEFSHMLDVDHRQFFTEASLREVLAARFERCEVVQSHPLDESIAGLVLPRPLMSLYRASTAQAPFGRATSRGCWGRAGWPAGSAGDARAGRLGRARRRRDGGARDPRSRAGAVLAEHCRVTVAAPAPSRLDDPRIELLEATDADFDLLLGALRSHDVVVAQRLPPSSCATCRSCPSATWRTSTTR